VHLEHSVVQHSVIVGFWSLVVPLGLTGLAARQDIRSREIPDWVPLTLVGWAVVATAMHWNAISWPAFGVGLGIGLAVGILLFASGGFGGGDAKLLIALGAALGWKGILVTLVLMGLFGGVMSIVAKFRGKRDLAYGPAIAAGVTGYALLYGSAVLLLSHHGVVVR
jgi:Flp pilus assembly protein protease CpaA